MPSLPRRFRPRPLAIAIALAAAAHAAAAAGIVFDVRPLGTLGGSQSFASGLNDAGQVVGTSLLKGDNVYQAFVHDGSTMRPLGSEPGGAQAVNAFGTVVGTASLSDGNQRAFIASGATVTPMGTLGGAHSYGFGINAAGDAVGGAGTAGGEHHAFVYTGGRMTDLAPDVRYSSALGINDGGQIVGVKQAVGDSQPHAFFYNQGVMVDLQPALGGATSYARAINGRGQIIGMVDSVGFIYDAGNVRRLSGAGLAQVMPVALNDAGLVVGLANGPDEDGTKFAFIAGSTGSLVDLNTRLAALPAARLKEAVAVNAHGQIAVNDVNGSALLLTPRGTLAWVGTAGGRLADGAQWDSGMGFAPTSLLDVLVAPSASQSIRVDADAAARSFTLGGGGQVTLQFERGARLRAGQGLTVNAGATLTGDGIVDAAVTNRGTVLAASGQQLTFAGGLQNHGVVGGTGRLAVGLVNHTDGTVRIGAAEVLVLAGSSHANAGVIEVRQGGELQTFGRLQNQTGGTLRLDAATLRLADGLDNAGAVQIGFGGASVFGAVDNRAGAKVIASGGSSTTFWDAVHNDGEVRASAGSRIVYFGAVSGAGSFTTNGSGAYHRFEAGYAPGNSPALVTLGNAEFTGTLRMELGGLQPGTAHDQIVFTGSVLFDVGATLDVALINGFVPGAGDAFRLFDYSEAPQGRFQAVGLPTLADGLAWDTSDLYGDGWLRVSAVPEPATWLLWGAGLAAVLRFRQRLPSSPSATRASRGRHQR